MSTQKFLALIAVAALLAVLLANLGFAYQAPPRNASGPTLGSVYAVADGDEPTPTPTPDPSRPGCQSGSGSC
jgi:hypothetical protein